eukprot:CAMPEP_0173072888 /NCGR_PEP_ID=MMETSP1102-20130122/10078_1 /TAXON_ID=49646 /ORGANISM="Geminigera sp., Strain Caron Lab Isolate" /LENGTH=45 /DNA_ID= /DNA_START= /DNA_END= /DNA_ORIENTATION=
MPRAVGIPSANNSTRYFIDSLSLATEGFRSDCTYCAIAKDGGGCL